ncbi:MAG: FtsW/RodA/SpoVE family cell cycle protein [Saprospiraceae bacterium]|nr:FtsW/RodA/SpoVE family cell cycle protein [Saprospiraceae bacterium]
MQAVINSIFGKLKGDKVIWLTVLGLSVFSLLAVYSSTESLAFRMAGGSLFYYLAKHFFVLGLGIVVMYLSHLVDYKYYSRLSQIFLWISIPLLIYTLIFGVNLNEARRWIQIPVINLTFQTSDFAKLALIMYTARVLSKKQREIKKFKEAFVPIILPIVIVCGLIAPADLSSAALLFVTCLIIMFIGRVNMKHILATILSGFLVLAMIIGILSVSENSGRLETWKQRIEDFRTDKDGPYQIQQAKIAIAKGGIVRIAPGKSTQRNYLPHPYSDFIYAIIIEEWGLLGGAVILGLYLLLLWRCIKIVMASPRAFGALLAVGLGFSLVIQALINMGVNVHLLPVTGLTLPMVSMGGSSIWFTGLAFGIILSVSRNIEEMKALKQTELSE